MKTTIQEHMLGFPMSLALSRARYLSHPSNRLHLSSSDDGFQSSIKKCKSEEQKNISFWLNIYKIVC